MNVSLEHQASVLSMEAFNFRASLTALTKVMPDFVNKIKVAFVNYMANDVGAIQLVPTKDIVKVAGRINYAAHRKTPIYGPAGLKTTYLDYLTAVEASVVITEDMRENQVLPFLDWVNRLLASPEELSSTRGLACPLKYTEKDIDAARSKLEKCVDRSSPQTKHEYGKLVKQNGDWTQVVTRTNHLITRFMTTNRKVILQDIEYLTESLDKLATRIQDDPETYKASGITVADLAKFCMTVARTVEFYSITGYLVAEVAGTVQETMNGVERLS